MRRVRITLGLAVAVCALAFSATAAIAHTFKAGIVGKTLSEATPAKIKGIGVGVQTFAFGPVHITCESVTTKGFATEEEAEALKILAKYSKCVTAIKVGAEPANLKTRIVQPVEYSFHASGFVATGTEGEEGSAEIGGGAVELKVSGIKCLISWPAQTVPTRAIANPEGVYTSAIFSNEEIANPHIRPFPSGFQHELTISTELKNMEFNFEEGQCAEFKNPNGKAGIYRGVLHEEVAGGNLSWE
jgi:hypothetical protein